MVPGNTPTTMNLEGPVKHLECHIERSDSNHGNFQRHLNAALMADRGLLTKKYLQFCEFPPPALSFQN